ncbi:transmembrane domain protein [Cystoisospora suis]|uniref:Transmembrane domain protein n=1 Tax=Cystoisospora suis TaxID=483139 RepID=A0A2C6LG91_9APIC|nr:transmembrane domain protein [Cystoisospora suis]
MSSSSRRRPPALPPEAPDEVCGRAHSEGPEHTQSGGYLRSTAQTHTAVSSSFFDNRYSSSSSSHREGRCSPSSRSSFGLVSQLDNDVHSTNAIGKQPLCERGGSSIPSEAPNTSSSSSSLFHTSSNLPENHNTWSSWSSRSTHRGRPPSYPLSFEIMQSTNSQERNVVNDRTCRQPHFHDDHLPAVSSSSSPGPTEKISRGLVSQPSREAAEESSSHREHDHHRGRLNDSGGCSDGQEGDHHRHNSQTTDNLPSMPLLSTGHLLEGKRDLDDHVISSDIFPPSCAPLDHKQSLASVREEDIFSSVSCPPARDGYSPTPVGTLSSAAPSPCVSPSRRGEEDRRNTRTRVTTPSDGHHPDGHLITSTNDLPTQLSERDLLPLRRRPAPSSSSKAFPPLSSNVTESNSRSDRRNHSSSSSSCHLQHRPLSSSSSSSVFSSSMRVSSGHFPPPEGIRDPRRHRLACSSSSSSSSSSSACPTSYWGGRDNHRCRALRRHHHHYRDGGEGEGMATMHTGFRTASERLDARLPPSVFFEAPSPAHPPQGGSSSLPHHYHAGGLPPTGRASTRGDSSVLTRHGHGGFKTAADRCSGNGGEGDGEGLSLVVSPSPTGPRAGSGSRSSGESRRRGSQVPRSVRTQRLSAGALALLHDGRGVGKDDYHFHHRHHGGGDGGATTTTGFFPFCPPSRAASFVRHVQAEATYGCYPIWTLSVTLWICLIGSALFLALGAWLLAEDDKHVECKLNYEDETLQEGGSRYSLINMTPEHCGQRGDTLVLKGPYIYVYVEMEGFYQNDAQVVWSRNERQLAGEIFTKAEDLRSCEPVVTAIVDNETKILHPCGVLAWNVFTDRFQFLDAEPDDAVDSGQIKPLLVEQGPSVLLKSMDWQKHFRNPPLAERAKHRSTVYFWMSQVDNDDGEDMYKSREEAKAELLNDRLNYEEAGDMVENGHFIQWMYVSTFSSWRKLYGRIRGPIELPIFAYIAVTYDVKLWRGKKAIVLVQPSLFGGRTQFIGIVYIVFACILAIFATYMLWKRFFRKEEYANDAFKDIRWRFNRRTKKKLK